MRLPKSVQVCAGTFLIQLWVIGSVLPARADAATPPAADHLARGQREIARAALVSGAIVLAVDRAGGGHLYLLDQHRRWQPVACEELQGAWGLWLQDVDGDGRYEALIALRKRAKFDPVLENRLHVYSFEANRCVPEWRGTRLAGRFDDLFVEADPPGSIVVWERVARGARRVARYRWRDFGFALEVELWRGHGSPPAPWRQAFQTLAHPRKVVP